MRVCTAAQMREIDRIAIEDFGVPGVVLMESAGRGVAEIIGQLRDPAGAEVALLCGGGNNGGDGFVIARHLIARGAQAICYLLTDQGKIGGDARINFDILRKVGGEVRSLETDEALAANAPQIMRADIVVDAIFGTGLNSEVCGSQRQAIELANRSRGLRVAVDIPSGLAADTGRVLGVAFDAEHTVTFAFPKLGLVSHPGTERVGRLHVVDIGIPSIVETRAEFAAELLEPGTLRARLLVRPPWGHKGTYGHLLVIAGSAGKTGAALLCAEAALRSGLGLCTVAAPPDVTAALDAKTVETMVEPLVPPGSGVDDSDETFAHLGALFAGKSAIAVGPGVPRDAPVAGFIARLVRESPLPLVVDADGLNHLVGQLDVLRTAAAPVLLTPHPGEMSRLLGRPVSAIQDDRVGAALELATGQGVFVALKGHRTVIAAPDGGVFINPSGNSGMGSAGTGDVLTGLVGGFLGQRHEAIDALLLGVGVHGAAGDSAAARVGKRSMLARDVIDEIGAVLKAWD